MPRDLLNVRIFAGGPAKGQVYGPAYLDKVVANYHLLRAGVKTSRHEAPMSVLPDSGLGHDPDQAMAKGLMARTDLPAYGWVDGLRRDGNHLVAGRIRAVPDEIATLIDRNAYRFCSSEFYNRFRLDDGTYLGPTLRRVAFLGFSPPGRKSLGPLPRTVASTHVDSFSCQAVGDHGGTTIFFSECAAMDRQQIIDQLLAQGVDAKAVPATVPDDVLAQMLQALHAGMAEKAGSTATADPAGGGQADPDAQPTAFAELASKIATLTTTVAQLVAGRQSAGAQTSHAERMAQPLGAADSGKTARYESMREQMVAEGLLKARPAK